NYRLVTTNCGDSHEEFGGLFAEGCFPGDNPYNVQIAKSDTIDVQGNNQSENTENNGLTNNRELEMKYIAHKIELDIGVYPNPARDILIIFGNDIEEINNITITDGHGRKVLEVNNSVYQIDITNLSSGFYLIN